MRNDIRTTTYEKRWETKFYETGHGMGLLQIPKEAKDLTDKIRKTLEQETYKIGCECHRQYLSLEEDSHSTEIFQLNISDPSSEFDGLRPQDANPEYTLQIKLQSNSCKEAISWLTERLVYDNGFKIVREDKD